MGSIRKAVIPAAGLGTRFLPISKTIPKELLPIGGKPSLQYVMEEAIRSGIREVIVVNHPRKKLIEDYFRSPETRVEDIEVTFVYQEEPLGLGHAVLCAEKAVGQEPFVVLLPDVIIDAPIPATQQLLDIVKPRGEWGLLLESIPMESVSSCGVILGETAGPNLYRIKMAIEKPKQEEAPSNLAICGRYLFTPDIFKFLKKTRPGILGEIQLTDAIDQLAREKAGYAALFDGLLFDVGTPQKMLRAWNHFVEM